MAIFQKQCLCFTTCLKRGLKKLIVNRAAMLLWLCPSFLAPKLQRFVFRLARFNLMSSRPRLFFRFCMNSYFIIFGNQGASYCGLCPGVMKYNDQVTKQNQITQNKTFLYIMGAVLVQYRDSVDKMTKIIFLGLLFLVCA